MRVLVCGGRDFANVQDTYTDAPFWASFWERKKKEYRFVLEKLDEILLPLSIERNPNDNWLPSDIEIISGMAKGADTAGLDWAAINFCKTHEFRADWKTHGKAAGPIRNQQMLDEGKPDLVVAFPGGKGTADMVRRAKKSRSKGNRN